MACQIGRACKNQYVSMDGKWWIIIMRKRVFQIPFKSEGEFLHISKSRAEPETVFRNWGFFFSWLGTQSIALVLGEKAYCNKQYGNERGYSVYSIEIENPEDFSY